MKNLIGIGWRRSSAIIAIAIAVASCGGGGGGSHNGGGSTTTLQEDKFGVQFGKDYRKDPLTGEPVAVNDGDVIPVSLTDEPVDVK